MHVLQAAQQCDRRWNAASDSIPLHVSVHSCSLALSLSLSLSLLYLVVPVVVVITWKYIQ